MATESIFAKHVIDTEWGVRALCDAYDEYEAQRRAYWEEHAEGDPSYVVDPDPERAAVLDRIFGTPVSA